MKTTLIAIISTYLVACGQTATTPAVIPAADQPDLTPDQCAPGGAFFGDANCFPTVGTNTRTGSCISLHGDSIMKGFGFADYNHPSSLKSIEGILKLGDSTICASTRGQSAEELWYAVVDGSIRDGDVVLFENAGPHFNDDTFYYDWLTQFWDASRWNSQQSRALNTNLVLTTTFDYPPSQELYNSQYDVPVNGGLSINQVVRNFAGDKSTGLLDWNNLMDQAVALGDARGFKVMLADGIHPSVFGNIVLALSVYKQIHPLSSYDRAGMIAQLVKYHADIVRLGFIDESVSSSDYDDIVGSLFNLVEAM